MENDSLDIMKEFNRRIIEKVMRGEILVVEFDGRQIMRVEPTFDPRDPIKIIHLD